MIHAAFLTRRTLLIATAALIALALALPLASAKPPSGGGTPPPVQYQLVTIGTFGGTSSWANGMNDDGDVVGAFRVGDNFSAFVWYNDGGAGVAYEINDLLDPAEGWNIHDATGINNVGQISGTAWITEFSRNVGVRINPPLAGQTYHTVTVVNPAESWASSINDSGDIVGDDMDSVSSFIYTDEIGLEVYPTRWGVMRFARCISNRINPIDPMSAFVAGSHSNANPKAVRYAPGGNVIFLGELHSGGFSQVSMRGGINDSGQCTGSADFNRWTDHAFRYTDGIGMKDLGPSKSIGSGAGAVNNAGDVIGGVGGDKPYPFLYLDIHGLLDVRKLSADIPDTATGISLRDINDGRDIAGDIGGVAVLLRATP